MDLSFVFPPAFFVTGTDTDVGKTFVSAVLAVGLQAHYWKPIQCGFEPYTDKQWIEEKTGLPAAHFLSETYLLKEAASPHLAAQLENIAIDIETIKIPQAQSWQHLIVEGAGGLMVPINDSFLVVDLIKHLKLPTLVVARSTLGTINHTLLTVGKLREKEIAILGVVMNGPKNLTNRQAIEKYGQVSVLAEIELIETVTPDSLKQIFDRLFKLKPFVLTEL